MTKAQRRRRAVIGAIALLEWRDRMRRENVDREDAERKTMVQYELMIAEMRAQADEPRTASRAPCKRITAAVHSNGAAGVLS
jgi:hypothetical protein